MSHEINRYEWEQMRASLAARDAEIRELRGVLSGTALSLESKTAVLHCTLEMERLRCREAEQLFGNLHTDHYGSVGALRDMYRRLN